MVETGDLHVIAGFTCAGKVIFYIPDAVKAMQSCVKFVNYSLPDIQVAEIIKDEIRLI